jgi:hypothetical protein
MAFRARRCANRNALLGERCTWWYSGKRSNIPFLASSPYKDKNVKHRAKRDLDINRNSKGRSAPASISAPAPAPTANALSEMGCPIFYSLRIRVRGGDTN